MIFVKQNYAKHEKRKKPIKNTMTNCQRRSPDNQKSAPAILRCGV